MFHAGLAGAPVVYVKRLCEAKRNQEKDHEDQVYKRSANPFSLGKRDGGYEHLNPFLSPALYVDWFLAQHRNFPGLDSIS